ncbi:hypothetical protein [Sphingobium phenoxybenzoativorans]
MRSSSTATRRMTGALCLAAAMTLSLAACSKGNEGGNATIAMKDMEVVDGTTSDAMTDLDGVRTEGTAMAPVAASNATAPRAAADSDANSAAPAEQSAEVVSDQ